jgi:hypothetical protein
LRRQKTTRHPEEWLVQPQALQISGSTQPEVFDGTVAAMAGALAADAQRFWQDSFARDGPIEIWEIGGRRFLYNGNHRYHAAIRAGVEIPDTMIVVVDRTGSTIPTFPLDQLDWLPGHK